MLIVEDVVGGYGEQNVINDVSFTVKKGEFLGILGPNGSGKTTLLNMLTGVQPIRQGSIFINGNQLNTYDPKALARLIAVLPQSLEQSFTYSVKEIVSLGRYPYQRGLIKTLSPSDKAIVLKAMTEVNVSQYADKSIHTLSGGEKQRVYLAQALAQQPSLLLLDEPTNHLDLSHQKKLLDSLNQWTVKNDLTVVAVFHDLNLASLYCDQILLLERGKINIHSTPTSVLCEETIKAVYDTETKRLIHPERSRPLITILPDNTYRKDDLFSFEDIAPDLNGDKLTIAFPFPLKTLSSAVIGAGFSWRTTFINRRVAQNYKSNDPAAEMLAYLNRETEYEADYVVAMMTAAHLHNRTYKYVIEEDFELFIVVTAGVGNAVDISRANQHEWEHSPIGTVNTWVFINGRLADEAFIQALITVTEAKVKAFSTERIVDPVTNTIATGTSTDSTAIAATQQGKQVPYAGTITPIGKALGEAVYTCTVEALRKAKEEVNC